MKKRCPKCGYIFEGEPASCPNCGVPFKWNKKVTASDESIDDDGDEVLSDDNTTSDVIEDTSLDHHPLTNKDLFKSTLLGLGSMIAIVLYGVCMVFVPIYGDGTKNYNLFPSLLSFIKNPIGAFSSGNIFGLFGAIFGLMLAISALGLLITSIRTIILLAKPNKEVNIKLTAFSRNVSKPRSTASIVVRSIFSFIAFSLLGLMPLLQEIIFYFIYGSVDGLMVNFYYALPLLCILANIILTSFQQKETNKFLKMQL